MATLLTIRDNIKNFCSKYDRFLTPAVKFVLAFAMFLSLSYIGGYNDTVSSGLVIFLLSLVCAFMTEGITLALGGAVSIMNYLSANTEVGITFILVFIIMYCIYIRFFPKTAWLIMYAPLFFILKLQYLLPVLAGMIAGPAGVVSAAFGCIFYRFSGYVKDYLELEAVTPKDDLVEGYRYIFQSFLNDKNLLLTILVFAVVIIITTIIYRLSFEYSWYAAIAVGGLFEIILFLIGNFVLEASVSIGGILIGSIFAMIIATIVQFFKVVVDYSRVENTQFEDDDYYYYVKAVPKVVMAKSKKKVKKINSVMPETEEEESVSGATR